MNQSPKSDVFGDFRPRCLEEVIEHCILSLESGHSPDRKMIEEKFPQWSREVLEFLNDWGDMEQFATSLASNERVDVASEDVPEAFGDYEIREQIGAGGMGAIYRARQISLNREVALKMIQGSRFDRDRFRLEAEAAASLEHPNIVSIYDIGEFEGRLFFTMQMIEGCNLQQQMENQPVSPTEAARIAKSVSSAVHFAHQHGILHRDLKPANIMLDAYATPHVTDFGLAKRFEKDPELTNSGTIVGTPGYMAPEQATGVGRSVTVATDVYGLGAILFALLTGEAPFTGNSSLDVLRKVVDEPARSPRMLNPTIHRDLETICLKCLEKNPDSRYESAEALACDLERFLRREPVLARPIPQTEKFWRWCKRNPTIACLTTAVLGLLIATTIFASFLAVSERNNRLDSEANGIREASLNRNLNRALSQAKQVRINQSNTNGLWQAERRNAGEALLWFSEAARLSEDDPEQRKRSLVRCKSWLREHPLPIGATRLDKRFCDDELFDDLSFRSDGEFALYRVGPNYAIWDQKSSESWYLNESFPELSSVCWQPNSSQCAVACESGEILLIDPATRESGDQLEFATNIHHFRFLNGGQWIAVACDEELQIFDVASSRRIGAGFKRDRRIRLLISNRSGNQLIVLYFGGTGEVFCIEQKQMVSQFDFKIQLQSIIGEQRPLYPMWLDNDQGIMVRISDSGHVVLDTDTGECLVSVKLPSRCYATAANRGSQLLAGSIDHAEYFSFSGGIGKHRDTDGGSGLSFESSGRLPHPNQVTTVAIHDSGLMATGGKDKKVRIWRTTPEISFARRRFEEPEPHDPIAILPHQTYVKNLAISPDGNYLITVQDDGLMRSWKIPNSKAMQYDVEVAAGGALIDFLDADHWYLRGMSRWNGHMENVSFHRIADGVKKYGTRIYGLTEDGHLLDADVSPDQDLLASIHAAPNRSASTFSRPDGTAGYLRFFSLKDRKPFGEPVSLSAEPRWVEWLPDGESVVVLTCRMDVILIDVNSRKIQKSWTVGNSSTRDQRAYLFPRYSINGQLLLRADDRRMFAWSTLNPDLRLWNFSTEQVLLSSVDNEDTGFADAAFSQDGRLLALAGGQSRQAFVFDIENAQLFNEGLAHPSAVNSVQFSNDGQELLTACRDGIVRVIDWQTGKNRLKIVANSGGIVDASFSPNMKFIATLGVAHRIEIWHAENGELALKPFRAPVGATHLKFSPCSKYLFATGGQIRVIDLGEMMYEPDLTIKRARKLSEVLANKRIVDGNAESLSSDEWMNAWEESRSWFRVQASARE